MTKTEKILQEYRNAYYNLHGKYPELLHRGSWVYLNNSPTAHRASDFEGFTKNLIKRLEERKTPEERANDEEDDIRKLLSAIRMDGRNIFRSTDIKKMQEAGKRIAKMARRILNILDDDELN